MFNPNLRTVSLVKGNGNFVYLAVFSRTTDNIPKSLSSWLDERQRLIRDNVELSLEDTTKFKTVTEFVESAKTPNPELRFGTAKLLHCQVNKVNNNIDIRQTFKLELDSLEDCEWLLETPPELLVFSLNIPSAWRSHHQSKIVKVCLAKPEKVNGEEILEPSHIVVNYPEHRIVRRRLLEKPYLKFTKPLDADIYVQLDSEGKAVFPTEEEMTEDADASVSV